MLINTGLQYIHLTILSWVLMPVSATHSIMLTIY